MPELPEAETITRQLRKRIVGRRVGAVRVARAGVVREGGGLLGGLRGRTITGVRRIGKAVLVEFSGSHCLLFRLGMTGTLIVDRGGSLAKHAHLALLLGPRLRVQFVDARRFGGVYAHTRSSLSKAAEVCRLGVDPLSPAFTVEWLRARLRGARRNLKSFLMDQRLIAGIGNIYASEILFRARLHPLKRSNAVFAEQAGRLREATVRVLRSAIGSGGTTVASYRDAEGQRGRFALRLLVYGREGEPCKRCGTRIRRMVIGQRSTFFCPKCQRAGRRRANGGSAG